MASALYKTGDNAMVTTDELKRFPRGSVVKIIEVFTSRKRISANRNKHYYKCCNKDGAVAWMYEDDILA